MTLKNIRNIVLVIVVVILILFVLQQTKDRNVSYQKDIVSEPSDHSDEVLLEDVYTKEPPTLLETDKDIYDDFVHIEIGDLLLWASVADSSQERQQGLSDTPYLPEYIVKLFVFEDEAVRSFWMKDMNYSIDIVWLNENKEIIGITENVSPESYENKERFSSAGPAKYVIETIPGLLGENGIGVGDRVEFDR